MLIEAMFSSPAGCCKVISFNALFEPQNTTDYDVYNVIGRWGRIWFSLQKDKRIAALLSNVCIAFSAMGYNNAGKWKMGW